MAYTKNTWNTGDIVTSEKLNHMEDGIEGGNSVLICLDTQATGYLDKTFGEIFDAYTSGKPVLRHISRSHEGDHTDAYSLMRSININYSEGSGEYDGDVQFSNGTYITGIVNSYEELLAERVGLSD